jgi:hypothetical protein
MDFWSMPSTPGELIMTHGRWWQGSRSFAMRPILIVLELVTVPGTN